MYTDKKNKLQAKVAIGVEKNRPKDYFQGSIYRINDDQEKQEQVSTIYGNYMGYLDIDGQRYFDVRNQKIQ